MPTANKPICIQVQKPRKGFPHPRLVKIKINPRPENNEEDLISVPDPTIAVADGQDMAQVIINMEGDSEENGHLPESFQPNESRDFNRFSPPSNLNPPIPEPMGGPEPLSARCCIREFFWALVILAVFIAVHLFVGWLMMQILPF